MTIQKNLTQNDQIRNFLSAFPEEFMNLSETEQKISIKLYRMLAKGNPVATLDIADQLNLQYADVKAVIDNWPGVFFNKNHEIIGYWGLTIEKTAHQFKINETVVYTWCAWDALFIPQILYKTAEVISYDPGANEEIGLTVSPEAVVDLYPASAVISFMMPEKEKIRTDIVNSFCHYIHFFKSKDSAEEWISKNDKKDELAILSLKEAFEIGSMKNLLQYKQLTEKMN